MKRIIFLSLAVVFVFSVQAQKKTYRFAIKSGYVKYKLTGNTTGTKELWWDNYGDKTRELENSKSVTKIFGMTNTTENHKLTILNRDDAWSVDYKTNEAFKNKVPFYEGKAVADNMTEAEQKKMADDVLAGFGGEKLGNEKVIGYNCEVISLMGAKTWIYKGVTLKLTSKIMGIENNLIAVVFKPNISVSATKFEEPKGVKFKSAAGVSAESSGGLLGALEQGLNAAKEEEEKYNDEVEEIVPVKYPYEKFKKKVEAFNFDGYKKFAVQKINGIYSAVFMKGFSDMLAVAASSRKNGDVGKAKLKGWFTYNGRKYLYYKEMEEGEQVAFLLEDIPAYDTYIVITSKTHQSKDELLKIADKFLF